MSSKKHSTGNIFFGKRLRKTRKSLKIRLIDLAKKISVGHSFLSQVERGEKSLSLEKLLSLTEILKINYHWLLTGKGSMFVKLEEEKKEAEQPEIEHVRWEEHEPERRKPHQHQEVQKLCKQISAVPAKKQNKVLKVLNDTIELVIFD